MQAALATGLLAAAVIVGIVATTAAIWWLFAVAIACLFVSATIVLGILVGPP